MDPLTCAYFLASYREEAPSPSTAEDDGDEGSCAASSSASRLTQSCSCERQNPNRCRFPVRDQKPHELGGCALSSRWPLTFEGVLTATPRGGGGTLVPIPKEVAAELGLKGFPKIQAVIAGTPYRGSGMPMGDRTFWPGVPKAIQAAAEV